MTSSAAPVLTFSVVPAGASSPASLSSGASVTLDVLLGADSYLEVWHDSGVLVSVGVIDEDGEEVLFLPSKGMDVPVREAATELLRVSSLTPGAPVLFPAL